MDVQKVWSDYGDQIKGFLASRVSNLEDAEDLLQEILIKTHKNLSSVKDPKRFGAWLFQLARNTLFDYYRKQVSKVPEKTVHELDLPAEDLPDQTQSVHAELSRCIRPFLSELPEIYRDAIVEADLNGTSQKELAKRWGVSHSAIKSRVQRGRQMLNQLFENCCSFELDAQGNIMDYEKKPDCCQFAENEV